jgi:hypothetical protein
MSFLSPRGARTAVFVIGLSGAALCALHAMDARADPPPVDDSGPCAEGRALFAARLAYLEARIAPKPDQEDAWRTFANAMRSSTAEVDRACVDAAPRRAENDAAGERLRRMAKRAAAMEAMFDAMAKAYVAVAPDLTTAQRDILSRNIAAPLPGLAPPPPSGGPGFPPPPGPMAMGCGRGGPHHGPPPPWTF